MVAASWSQVWSISCLMVLGSVHDAVLRSPVAHCRPASPAELPRSVEATRLTPRQSPCLHPARCRRQQRIAHGASGDAASSVISTNGLDTGIPAGLVIFATIGRFHLPASTSSVSPPTNQEKSLRSRSAQGLTFSAAVWSTASDGLGYGRSGVWQDGAGVIRSTFVVVVERSSSRSTASGPAAATASLTGATCQYSRGP